MEFSRLEALEILGLDEGFGPDDLKRARRRALLRHHPDHGGRPDQLARIEAATRLLGSRSGRGGAAFRREIDRPSFTIGVLPAEAFELILLAAAELGDVVDDDPPYRLEVRMHEPRDTWIVLDVLPDAGSSTVSLWAEGPAGFAVEELRDAWVDAINQVSIG